MEPAASIIARLGGMSRVAQIVGTSYTAPYRWTYAKAQGGTGGRIPQKYHRLLLNVARSEGVPLTAEDLLPLEEKGA